MNAAEYIRAQVRWLAEKDEITRTQLVEIIEKLLDPWDGHSTNQLYANEPPHFGQVSEMVHRIVDTRDRNRGIDVDAEGEDL